MCNPKDVILVNDFLVAYHLLPPGLRIRCLEWLNFLAMLPNDCLDGKPFRRVGEYASYQILELQFGHGKSDHLAVIFCGWPTNRKVVLNISSAAGPVERRVADAITALKAFLKLNPNF